VEVEGHTAILSGVVDSWYQKNEAGKIAFKAPGVWAVDNELIVDYDYALMD
jgi:osmotically-inducible protein OsmY